MRFTTSSLLAAAGLVAAAPQGQVHHNERRAVSGTPPTGTDTSGVSRSQLGSVPYGPTTISNCVNAGDIALTYDDGPYYHTSQLLDLLAAEGVKATFFLNGDNYGRGYINAVADWRNVITRMVNEGHQVASHTWDHADLNTLSADQQRTEMYWNEIAINDILGKFPTYMRPPYGSCSGTCGSTMGSLGYHIIMWNVDTELWNGDYNSAINTFNNAVGNPGSSSYIVLEHDPLASVIDVSRYYISNLKSKGFNPVTVGECLGDPSSNWYRSLSDGGGNDGGNDGGSGGGTVSTDATCGNGVTCLGSAFGSCCSVWGWCGSSDEYCGDGCQTAWGSCGSSSGGGDDGGNNGGGSTGTSTDGTCGSANSLSCPSGQCCSQWGWCGTSGEYCSSGCQSGFGTCW